MKLFPNHLSAFLLTVIFPVFGLAQQRVVYKDPTAPVEQRVEDLLSRMTQAEKLMQLRQDVVGRDPVTNVEGFAANVPPTLGSLIYKAPDYALRNYLQRRAVEQSRLGIPLLFGDDVIHGYRTIFPIPLAQACSWNPELLSAGCRVAAREARLSGVDWTFAPMVDVSRDPRWGRIAESFGEDPYAAGVFAAAAVKGYQGNWDAGLPPHGIAACLKHFVGYGASEAGRDYVYTEISRQSLWDTYLPPFEAGVRAGAATLMSAFNDISGTPATANRYTLTDVLRGRWGFKGFVVSDWGAINQLQRQGMAANQADAAALSLHAGVDVDMVSRAFDTQLSSLVGEGRVSQAEIDEAVRRVLRVKFQMGLFDHPNTPDNAEATRFLLPESRAAAAQMAAESAVLLKNDGGVLPLAAGKRIAVVGPLATATRDLMGCWVCQGQAADVQPLLDAFREEFGPASVGYAQGCQFDGADTTGFADAVRLARTADVVVVCGGEEAAWSGENASYADITLPLVQRQLIGRLKETGKPVVLVLGNGRPLVLADAAEQADAILEIWAPGTCGAPSVAGLLSGRLNPSGRLAVTFPRSVGQIPIYYNRRNAARSVPNGHYKDLSVEPLYTFGHGLSYTSFAYGDVSATDSVVSATGRVRLQVDVANTGSRDGMETVFWYVTDPYSTITRPVRELHHFEKRLIRAGQTEHFVFDVDVERDLGFVDADGHRFVEPGDVYVSVGPRRICLRIE